MVPVFVSVEVKIVVVSLFVYETYLCTLMEQFPLSFSESKDWVAGKLRGFSTKVPCVEDASECIIVSF